MRKYPEILLLVAPVLVMLFAIAGGGIGDAAWLGMKVDIMHDSQAARMGVPANAGRVVVVAVEGPAL